VSRELFERKCREHGGRIEPEHPSLCKMKIEGIEWPFYEGIVATTDYTSIFADVYLPLTPSYRLSERGWKIFDRKADAAGLKHSYPIKSFGTYHASLYADIGDFDKLVSVLREIGREWKALFGE
jgi:hypothetical protein